MKCPTKVQRLRAQLGDLIAQPGPSGMRGLRMWHIAEEISATTDEPVRAVFDRGVKDAVALELRRAFP
jgi:hypothetical protein